MARRAPGSSGAQRETHAASRAHSRAGRRHLCAPSSCGTLGSKEPMSCTLCWPRQRRQRRVRSGTCACGAGRVALRLRRRRCFVSCGPLVSAAWRDQALSLDVEAPDPTACSSSAAARADVALRCARSARLSLLTGVRAFCVWVGGERGSGGASVTWKGGSSGEDNEQRLCGGGAQMRSARGGDDGGWRVQTRGATQTAGKRGARRAGVIESGARRTGTKCRAVRGPSWQADAQFGASLWGSEKNAQARLARLARVVGFGSTECGRGR
ncbi:hypothetical protein TRVL_08989 [Trypanosoma vivax]|nr:hypothetical protein TRVL_08989 [Trypanosoma vivax]